MNFLIVGDGEIERAWARSLETQPGHRVIATVPRHVAGESDSGLDLDAALTTPGVEAVVVGGLPAARSEALLRVVKLGLPAICLHPPAPTADTYYEIALEYSENRPIVIPDLPMRLHPAMAAMQAELAGHELRSVRAEVAVAAGSDLIGVPFARVADGVWSLIGAVEAVTATATPAGPNPPRTLTAHLKAMNGTAAELRLTRAPAIGGPSHFMIMADEDHWIWTFDESFTTKSTLSRVRGQEQTVVGEFPPWDAHAALVRVLEDAIAGKPAAVGLDEGIRAMELSDAVARSLKRGRTVEMHYDEISELSSFKANMTSLGCGLVLLSLVLYVLSRVGLALGMDAAKYLGWAVVPLLSVYALLQLLRFAARPARK